MQPVCYHNVYLFAEKIQPVEPSAPPASFAIDQQPHQLDDPYPDPNTTTTTTTTYVTVTETEPETEPETVC